MGERTYSPGLGEEQIGRESPGPERAENQDKRESVIITTRIPSRSLSSPGPFFRALIGLMALSVTLTAGCGGEESPGSGGGGGGWAAGGNGGGRGKNAAPPLAVATSPATAGSIASFYEATASLEAENKAEITARVSGIVGEVLVEEGQNVTKGQTMLRIDAREYRLRVRQAEALAEKERTRYARVQRMFEQNLVSEEEFSSTKNDLDNAEASLELAQLELSYTSVRAPFAGKVVARMTDIGRNVSPGDALYSVADVRPLLARVHVPAREFRSLRTDQQVSLSVDSTGDRLDGVISLVSPVIDSNTGTIKVTVEIEDYPDRIRPGDFVSVRIVTEKRDDVVLVPKESVVSEKGENFVFTVVDSAAVRRPVETGFEDDENIQITSGLDRGELVVVQGQRSLKDGAPVKVLGALRFADEAPDSVRS